MQWHKPLARGIHTHTVIAGQSWGRIVAAESGQQQIEATTPTATEKSRAEPGQQGIQRREKKEKEATEGRSVQYVEHYVEVL